MPAQIRIIGLSEWSSKGPSNFMDLLDSNSVKSFEQIRANFNISHKDFFKYLQICHFIKSLWKTGKLHTNLLQIENIIVMAKSKVSFLSYMVRYLVLVLQVMML